LETLLSFSVAGVGNILCVQFGKTDDALNKLYLKNRTSIWTAKYHESVDADGYEVDLFDNESLRLAFIAEDDPARFFGGCRVVLAGALSKLPMGVWALQQKEWFTKSADVEGEVLEVSRFFMIPIIPREARGELLYRSLCAVETIGRKRDIPFSFASVKLSLFQTMERFRFEVARIGSDQQHGPEDFVPARIRVRDKDLVPSFEELVSKTGRYAA
jgi:N-acyl-L-homoserine lactone synthetase